MKIANFDVLYIKKSLQTTLYIKCHRHCTLNATKCSLKNLAINNISKNTENIRESLVKMAVTDAVFFTV